MAQKKSINPRKSNPKAKKTQPKTKVSNKNTKKIITANSKSEPAKSVVKKKTTKTTKKSSPKKVVSAKSTKVTKAATTTKASLDPSMSKEEAKAKDDVKKMQKSWFDRKKNERHHLKHHPLLTFVRIIKNGFSNFFRNTWLSVAATAIMVVTLTTILVALFANKILSDSIDKFGQEIKLSIFLEDEATVAQRQELKDVIGNDSNVIEVTYTSKEQALEDFKNSEGDSILSSLTLVGDDVLPASYQVKVDDLSMIENTVKLAELPQFEDVVNEVRLEDEQQEVIDRFTSGQEIVAIIGFSIAGIFALISAMVIFNTIRLAIYSRSDEIEIMKLLGATKGYIRGPFVFESMIYGLVAGIISVLTVGTVIRTVMPRITETIDVQTSINFFNENWLLVSAFTVGAGMMIGFICSVWALRRYLKY